MGIGPQRQSLRGTPGSPGVAYGPCTVFSHVARVGQRGELGRESGLRHSKTYVAESAIDAELLRLRVAVERAQRHLTQAISSVGAALGDQRVILEAYFLMLDDPLLHERIREHIIGGRLCAEWAVSEAASELSAAFAALDGSLEPHTQHLAERRHDVDFVADKLLRSLVGDQSAPLLHHACIVVATDLSPAELVQLDRNMVLGLVVERGTKTSHTSILARALGLPTVVGAADATSLFHSDDMLLLDGRRGEVISHPTEEERALVSARASLYATRSPSPARQRSGEAEVELAATIQLPNELEDVFRFGAHSVGLCRTEFLFLDQNTPPDEDEQFEVYATLVRTMRGRSIALRTFDLGGDKPSSFVALPAEQNPALGLRAIRIGLRDPALLITQLRAILRASRLGDVKLLLPMISTLAEVRAVRQLIDAASRQLQLTRPIPVGIMVEVPAVAVLADLFAGEVDFFSVGTNDLVQYTLAVDRSSHPLAELSSPLDPAVLRLIALSAQGAQLHGIPLAVCGAATADPLAAVVFAGLGAASLSMEARALPLVREALGRVGRAGATRLASHVLKLGTAAEVEGYLARELEPRLGSLLLER